MVSFIFAHNKGGRVLRTKNGDGLYYFVGPLTNRVKKFGANPDMTGKTFNLEGNCTGIYGNINKGIRGVIGSFLTGDLSGLYGYISERLCGQVQKSLVGSISGLDSGNLSGLTGDATGVVCIDCTGWNGNLTRYFGRLRELTAEEIKEGKNVRDFVSRG